MSSAPTKKFYARELDLELLEPDDVVLTRLYRHPGGDWDPPPEKFRNLRVDPPAGSKDRFAVLYTADSIQAVAVECRVLVTPADDRCTWSSDLASQYKVARYTLGSPAVFMPIDGRNRNTLSLDGRHRKFGGYEAYQEVALELYERFGRVVHGLSWESFHRGQPGRIYALWHHHKDTVGLHIDGAGAALSLAVDPQWLAFLRANPDIEEISPGTS